MQCNAIQYLHLKHFFQNVFEYNAKFSTLLYLTICARGHFCHRNLFDYGRRTKTNCNNFCCCSRFSVVEYLRIHSMDDMSELSREIVNCIAKMTTFYERWFIMIQKFFSVFWEFKNKQLFEFHFWRWKIMAENKITFSCMKTIYKVAKFSFVN